MADLHDALAALHAADDARRNAQAYGGAIEDGRESDAALAVLLATEAWCAELRALTVTADYLAHKAAR